MTSEFEPEPHDRPTCGARKRQPRVPGERCARPAGWGTTHPGYGRCKLHGGATPYRQGRYSRVVCEFLLPSIRHKACTYHLQMLASSLRALIRDPARREEVWRLVLAESGLDGGAEPDPAPPGVGCQVIEEGVP